MENKTAKMGGFGCRKRNHSAQSSFAKTFGVRNKMKTKFATRDPLVQSETYFHSVKGA